MLRVLCGIFLARVSVVDFSIIRREQNGLASLVSLVDFSVVEDKESLGEEKTYMVSKNERVWPGGLSSPWFGFFVGKGNYSPCPWLLLASPLPGIGGPGLDAAVNA